MATDMAAITNGLLTSRDTGLVTSREVFVLFLLHTMLIASLCLQDASALVSKATARLGACVNLDEVIKAGSLSLKEVSLSYPCRAGDAPSNQ